MSNTMFERVHPNAILPTTINDISYDVYVIDVDHSEVIDGEQVIFFRTGLEIVQSNSRVMYLHQKYFDYEEKYHNGFTFRDKITVIYSDDNSEIIIPMKVKPGLSKIDEEKIYMEPVGTLISRKKNENVFVNFITFPGYEEPTEYDFMQVNGNEKELNYLINILVPVKYSESYKDGAYTFTHLQENFTENEVRAVQKTIGAGIHRGILKHIKLRGDTPKQKAVAFATAYSYGRGPPVGKFFKKNASDPDEFYVDSDENPNSGSDSD